MTLMRRIGWRRGALAILVVTVLTMAAIKALSNDVEIALDIGEPYEAMRQRSSASIGPALAGRAWFNIPKSDARLRFANPQYGFVTPLARFFTVMYKNGMISSVRISPQIEPLLLDDTLKVVLDLQEQWLQAGWVPTRASDFPPIADTPAWRVDLRNERKGGTTYWQAGNQYQVMLVVNRFEDAKRPDEERYLITLQLATPWVKP
ncbi:MAG: hypothetical protein PW845_19960 [Pseudomonas sp.]|uniref:hypothetical protein n=1 Tax=Pseudomonas abieticivorans TaxID=2931382 RepID=UPI0020BED920|nr:hypothetical protein [Pseudomonas sp. PIA16]MDE1167581.1 hypothetical protein [Pseudomonas sp.]